VWELVLRKKLQSKYNLRIIRFGEESGFYPGPDDHYRTELLELVAKESFDLILVYSHMEWGEIELFTNLRTQYGKPIIASSGFTNVERDDRLKAAGIIILPCPHTVEEFVKSLDACFSSSKLAQSSD